MAELRRLFGSDLDLTIDGRPFSDAQEIAARFLKSGSHELVAVAPLTVLKALCERGLQPLYAEMEEVPPGSRAAELTTGGNGFGRARPARGYRFLRFRRLTGVSFDFEDIEPCPTK